MAVKNTALRWAYLERYTLRELVVWGQFWNTTGIHCADGISKLLLSSDTTSYSQLPKRFKDRKFCSTKHRNECAMFRRDSPMSIWHVGCLDVVSSNIPAIKGACLWKKSCSAVQVQGAAGQPSRQVFGVWKQKRKCAGICVRDEVRQVRATLVSASWWFCFRWLSAQLP